MAFKKVSGGSFKYVKYAECEEGQVLAEGTYLGHRQGTYGIQHQIKEDSGDITVLNSSGHLNWLLENLATPGDCVRVTYDGMVKVPKGPMKGKASHQFVLELDEERKTAGVQPVSSAPKDDSEETEEDDSDDSDEVEEVKYKRSNSGRDLKRVVAETDEGEDEEEAPAPRKVSGDDVLSRYRRK